MEKSKKPNLAIRILNLFIFAFIIVYIVNNSGYINTYNLDKTYYTEDKIVEFEEDVKNNKPLLDSYLDKENVNYTNKFSKAGEDLSFLINKGCKKIFNELVKFFTFLLT